MEIALYIIWNSIECLHNFCTRADKYEGFVIKSNLKLLAVPKLYIKFIKLKNTVKNIKQGYF